MCDHDNKCLSAIMTISLDRDFDHNSDYDYDCDCDCSCDRDREMSVCKNVMIPNSCVQCNDTK